MNKIIVFANMKGGVGKTTLCSFFAMFLHGQGIPVVVVDADVQQSLVRHRDRDLEAHPDTEEPYQIVSLNTAKDDVKDAVKQLKNLDATILVDCPGNVQDSELIPILSAADIVVIPTRYDEDNIDATLLFVEDYLTRISHPKIFFIPNCINYQEERRKELQEARAKAIEQLGKYGTITPRIKQSVVINCYSTLAPLDYYQRNAVKFAFEGILAAL